MTQHIRQEHRFVADVYRFIAPFIDMKKDVYLSLDGMAAKRGVALLKFQDRDVPDVWFTLIDSKSRTLIEAKVINNVKRIKLSRAQVSNWRTRGQGAQKPAFWIATDMAFARFYFWSQQEFLPILDSLSVQRQKLFSVNIPPEAIEFKSIEVLALQILKSASS